MSIKAWKRVITLVVILLILGLGYLAANYLIKYYKLVNTEVPDTVVDLADYGIEDTETLENALNYFGSTTHNESLTYQEKYPDLYVDNDFKYYDTGDQKICYLTFDDGPSSTNTSEILDTLLEYNVKATFFVVYNDTTENREILKRMVAEGHTIGVHTASHNYKSIYESVSAYLKDFNLVATWIEETTGYKPEIFRFPGGSVNSYNARIYQEIISEMLRRGYTYYDWNSSSGDAADNYVSSEEIANNVLYSTNYDETIVLMHDGRGHGSTVQALGTIIEQLSYRGYSFKALDKTVKPIKFDYTD